MTMKTIKQRTALLLLPVGGIAAVAFAISWLGSMGAASAHAFQVAVPATQTPDPGAAQLVDLLLSGKYLVVVGLLMPAAVALFRTLLGKLVPWFGTKSGGVLMVYSTSVLLYLGSAWASGSPADMRLILLALGSALAATGAWEHLKDILGGIKEAPAAAAKVASSALLIAFVASVSCAQTQAAEKLATTAGKAILDCTKQDKSLLLDAALAFGAEVVKYIGDFGRVDWKTPGTKALNTGTQIAACSYLAVRAAYAAKPELSIAHASARLADDGVTAQFQAAYPGGITLPDGKILGAP